MMAKPSNSSTEKSLMTFSASLEDLTFNSKPIIDELTRFAGSYQHLAPQLVQSVEDHILEVRPEWKLPSLYLLDSILKNVKGEYLKFFSKNIVRIFCHCFEKLTEPDARKALYKLRQTWSQYIEIRKLALIDKHVHALDPHWPVTAIEKNPSSPTIFVNPIFIKSSDKNKSNGPNVNTKSSSQSPKRAATTKKPSPPKPVKRVAFEVPSAKETISHASNEVPKTDSKKKMAIQEKRKKLLQEKKSERIRQQEALGISSEAKRGNRSGSSPSSRHVSALKVSSPRARSASPRVRSASPRARSASPRTIVQKTIVQKTQPEQSMANSEQLKPPPEKRPKLEPAPTSGPEVTPVLSDSEPKEEVVTSKEPPKTDTDAASSDEPHLIKGSQLELDDIPPELLPKHHELILKQIQAQLNSGNLSSEQHSTLCKQLDQLYELQKQKEESGRAKSSPPPKAEQTDKSNDDKRSVPSDNFVSLSGTNSDSPFFVDSHGSSSNDNFNFVSRGGSHHDHRGRHHDYSRHPPPPGPYRGDPRPPFRERRRPYPTNRHPRGRYFNDGPPPHMDRRRGHMMSGPPPPNWQEPPPRVGGYRNRTPPPSMDVSHLINQLAGYGMLDGSKNESGGLTRNTPPVTVPTLGFTSATLKQKYGALIEVLHVGQQCGTCGVRFPSNYSDEYEKHLDWHYRLNKTDGQTTTSRNWFLHPEDWVKFEELSEESQEKEAILKPTPGESQEEEEVRAPSGEAVNSCLVLSGEENKVCVICQEPLEQFWEDDEDAWHYKDAIRSQLTGKLYHTFCFQDAKEDDLNASNNSAQPTSPEVKEELDT